MWFPIHIFYMSFTDYGAIYFLGFDAVDFVYNLKEIKLAKDATNVPSPPILVPSKRLFASLLNPESITAAGTLLIN